MTGRLNYPGLTTPLDRARMYLENAKTYVEEALQDVALADKAQPEKKNEISKLRVKINRTKLRLRTLARHADTLSQNNQTINRKIK